VSAWAPSRISMTSASPKVTEPSASIPRPLTVAPWYTPTFDSASPESSTISVSCPASPYRNSGPATKSTRPSESGYRPRAVELTVIVSFPPPP